MIKFIPQGDIFLLENVSSYAHGCNCAGAMGKGIAIQFRNKFPAMYAEYKLLCKNGQYIPVMYLITITDWGMSTTLLPRSRGVQRLK